MRSMVYFLTLLAVCVAGGESALLGSRECTYGPSYWCASIIKAKECNAVTHCIHTVWEKKVLPEDNDDICSLCKDMVQQARDQLLSNETQELIREVFDGSCNLIPIKLIRHECLHLANDFIPELIDALASQMNPQVVCATAGLCNSLRVDRLILEYKRAHAIESNAIIRRPAVQTPQPGDCEACKDFIARTIRLVKTHSRAELMDRLFAICGRLGSVSDGCMALVEANFDGIYNFLTEQLTPDDFCDLVEMCETRMHDLENYQRAPLPQTGDEPCDFCVAIVQHWRDVLTANTTELEFKQILDGLCHQMGSFSQNCLSLVDEYYLPLYNILMAEIHPKDVCEAVGLCGANSVFAQQHPVFTILDVNRPSVVARARLTPAQPIGEHLIGTDEAAASAITSNKEEEEPETQQLPRVSIAHEGIAVSPAGRSGVVRAPLGKSHVGDDNKCVMCQFALHFLQNMLEQKDTRGDIEDAVERLCDLMPQSIAEQCEDYVEAYGDQVIELLAQEMDPSQICPELHLCPAESEALASVPVSEDVTCVMCEYAMTQLEEILQNHKTEENIRHALDQLCSMLPSSVRDECQLFVDAYTEQVIHMLIEDFTPDQICIQLMLCKPKEPELPVLDSSNQLPVSRMFIGMPSSDASHSVEEEHGVSQSTVCVLCEFAMLQLDQLLGDNATESEIMEVVDFVCAHLPGTLQDDCIGFVEQYGDAIIKLLVHELDPEVVCQEMKLCKPPKHTGLRATLNMNFDTCGICEYVVTEVDEKLKDPEIVVVLDTDAEELCRLLPNAALHECINIVEVYGPYLVNLLRELMAPDRVCQGVGLCPKATNEPLLGAEKCTWGPSYWCQTQLHAAACKATMHCRQTVWLDSTPEI
ncbi:hypothetical protein Pcinc_004153 [Petrolisthes cinctipes]|uniref:Saposin n=1 Tax=Petrolisthes cinctipes TaxID=88211 RepID=A0AAE1GGC9_PETCI|nr:hypothetical protein Pcinc_004153 [Petrolisthes cinctipes]